MRLKGRTALITGSGRGMGKGIALEFARQGANVITNSRSTPDECEALAEQCRAFGGKSIGITADLSSREGVDLLARKAIEAFGRVDILVNNLGISPYLKLLDITDEEWHKVMFVDLDQMFMCTKHFIPGMMEQKWGRILFITGHAAKRRHKVGAHTCAAKAGAMGLMRAVASEFAPYGITANEVCPGWMNTEIRRNQYYMDAKPANQRPWGADERVNEIPLGRLGTIEEFGNFCAFLASDEGSYLTGQTYLINGGTLFH